MMNVKCKIEKAFLFFAMSPERYVAWEVILRK